MNTIRLANIPIHNLRQEFEEFLAFFGRPEFRDNVFNSRVRPVALPRFSWNGLPHDLLTLMLQRAVLGTESYLPAAVEYELATCGPISLEARSAIRNPYSLARSTAKAFYDRLPALIDSSKALSRYDQALYNRVREFYRDVRNPIFHGFWVDFSAESYDAVAAAFSMLAQVYDWIDSWYGAFEAGWQERRSKMTMSSA